MGRKPPPPDARRELTALLEEVQSSTRALSSILQDSGDLDPDVAAEMRAHSNEIDRCLARQRLSVILLGEPGARRDLLDHVLGFAVFGPGQESPGIVTLLRSANHIDYKATLANGMVEEFASRIPDRTATFTAALGRAERELEAAEQALRGLVDQIDGANAELATKQESFDEQPPQAAIRPVAWSQVDVPTKIAPAPLPAAAPPPPAPPQSFFAKLWAWILSLFGSKPKSLPAIPPPPPSMPSSAPVPVAPIPVSLGSDIVRLREAVHAESLRHDAGVGARRAARALRGRAPALDGRSGTGRQRRHGRRDREPQERSARWRARQVRTATRRDRSRWSSGRRCGRNAHRSRGIGTAIGAFIGVFAGFLKGIDSLKKDCVQKLEGVLDDAEKEIRAQIETRTKTYSEAIRASLEDAFDSAMQRFEQSIARLMALEKKTLDKENAKLQRLKELQTTLASHEARFAELAKLAAKAAAKVVAPPSPQKAQSP